MGRDVGTAGLVNQGPDEIAVHVAAYREMVKLGERAHGALRVGPNSRHSLQLPPGSLVVNPATYIALNLINIMPMWDGWYSGMASLQLDNSQVGRWRQFQFCARNADCPTVVHFEPSTQLVGWQPEGYATGLDQWVYSFSIIAAHPQDQP